MNIFQKYFKQKPNIRNIYHPDIWPYITKSFVGPGVHGKNTQYYTWKGGDLLDDTIGRYHAADRHVTEFAMKMNVDELVKYIDIIIGHLEPNEGGKIKVGLATAKLYEMKERTKLLATNDTLLRLASCVYIDDTELLDSYDYKHGNMKIKLWRENSNYDFFFIKPMSELWKHAEFSKTTFLDYLKQADEEIKKSRILMDAG